MQKMECGDVRALAESSMGAAADNADLLERIACGDAAAFVELMRRYDALVGATVRNCHLSHADAADAVQNTWMRLLERSSTIREPEKLGGWLATTARRECLVEIRRRRHELQYDPSGMEYPCLDPTPEDLAIREDTRRALRHATEGLVGRARELINALYSDPTVEHYTDLAKHLQMPIGSIGPTRARALRSLRRELSEFGYTMATT
jgi:RNA polymerase sigma factor (sigma-70 family)